MTPIHWQSSRAVDQDLRHGFSQHHAVGQIKSVSPTAFSQKLYQSHALEIAEEYEQALEANSLEKIINLLDKLVEPGEGG